MALWNFEAENERQHNVTKESVSPDVPNDQYHTKSGRIVRKPSYLKDAVYRALDNFEYSWTLKKDTFQCCDCCSILSAPFWHSLP